MSGDNPNHAGVENFYRMEGELLYNELVKEAAGMGLDTSVFQNDAYKTRAITILAKDIKERVGTSGAVMSF